MAAHEPPGSAFSAHLARQRRRDRTEDRFDADLDDGWSALRWLVGRTILGAWRQARRDP